VRPVLVLERVYARDAAGPRGRARGAIVEASLALGPAVHAVLGAPEDGALAFFDAVTGARAPNRGRVTVAGRDPARTAFVRARIGALAPEPRLPPAATVGDAVKIAMRARGETGDRFDAVLDPLGLGRLHARRPASLSFAEARGVELALSLSTPAPLLVALHEPLADVAVTPREAVGRRLRELAATGACVVVVTSSPADARSLADRVVVLHKGLVAREATQGEGLAPADEIELVAWVAAPEGARALSAALSQRPEIHAVAWEEGRSAWPAAAAVRARGDAAACALAMTEAALAAGVEVEAITSRAPGMGEVRAATEALWKAARAQPAWRPAPGPPPPPAAPAAEAPPPAPAAAAPEPPPPAPESPAKEGET
jgi:ABC-2 type transport system ATP-binding protein